MYFLSVIFNKKDLFRIDKVETKSYEEIIEEIKELYFEYTGGKIVVKDIGWRDPEYIEKPRSWKKKFHKNIEIGRIFTNKFIQNMNFSEDSVKEIHKRFEKDIWIGAGAVI